MVVISVKVAGKSPLTTTSTGRTVQRHTITRNPLSCTNGRAGAEMKRIRGLDLQPPEDKKARSGLGEMSAKERRME
ncbi:hypothetical protein BHE74_00049608 [Ensete ventricosum]|nr:hypothetical protein BHE74_00049608 [Ensete ventricosum]